MRVWTHGGKIKRCLLAGGVYTPCKGIMGTPSPVIRYTTASSSSSIIVIDNNIILSLWKHYTMWKKNENDCGRRRTYTGQIARRVPPSYLGWARRNTRRQTIDRLRTTHPPPITHRKRFQLDQPCERHLRISCSAHSHTQTLTTTNGEI